jgi:hypothetical protein
MAALHIANKAREIMSRDKKESKIDLLGGSERKRFGDWQPEAGIKGV